MRTVSYMYAGMILILLVMALTGCSTSAPKQTSFMQSVEGMQTTTRELQLLVYAYAEYYDGTVALAAQSIQDQTYDPVIRENAINWKLKTVPAMYQKCFTPDPLSGGIRAWAYCIQLRQYFTTGNGQDVFGPYQYIAIETSQDVEDLMMGLVQSTRPDSSIATLQAKIETWATEHPIENQLFISLPPSKDFYLNMAGPTASGLKAAAAMNEQMLALNDRMTLFTTFIPNQVQWQTELMLARTPELIATHGDSLMMTLQKRSQLLLEPLFLFMEDQRTELTKALADERNAVLEGIASERIAVLTALSDERIAVMLDIARERNLTMEQMDALTLATIQAMVESTDDVTDAAIDRVFQRTFQLLAIPFLCLVAFGVGILWLIRSWLKKYAEIRGPSARGPQA